MSQDDTALRDQAEKAYHEYTKYTNKYGLLASEVSALRENENGDETFSLMIEIATFTGDKDLFIIPQTEW